MITGMASIAPLPTAIVPATADRIIIAHDSISSTSNNSSSLTIISSVEKMEKIMFGKDTKEDIN